MLGRNLLAPTHEDISPLAVGFAGIEATVAAGQSP